MRAFTGMAHEDAVLHDDGAVAVLRKGLAVRAFEVVRELLELVYSPLVGPQHICY